MAEKDGAAHQGGPVGAADLEQLDREALNTLAHERGVENPEGLANKGEVVEAIRATPESDEAREAREKREQEEQARQIAEAEQAAGAERQQEIAAEQAQADWASVDNGPPLAQVAEEQAALEAEAPELIPAPGEE